MPRDQESLIDCRKLTVPLPHVKIEKNSKGDFVMSLNPKFLKDN